MVLGGGLPPGLTPDIDSALVGTSWKDNTTGSLITVVFAAGGITWGGSAGSILNTTTSAYQGTGYTFVWIAKDGAIFYKYSYNNGPVYTAPVYAYVLGPGTLELKSGGVTFATLIPNWELAGTSWAANIFGNVYKLTFQNSSEYLFTRDTVNWQKGTYSVSGNTLSLTPTHEWNTGTSTWDSTAISSTTGTISANTMDIFVGGGVATTFTKQ